MATTEFWLALIVAGLATLLLAVSGAFLVRMLRPTAKHALQDRSPAAPPALEPNGGSEVTGLDQAREELRRARQLAALATTLDLDHLLTRVLETVVTECRADCSAISVRQSSGQVLSKTYKLADQEVPPSLDERWDASQARALAMRYRYSPLGPSRADPILTGLVVPLEGEDEEQIGTLAVYWRRQHEPADEELTALEQIAVGSSRAIENARRFKEASELATRDALTGLFNRRYFHETLAREVKRAQRYTRSLALVLIDLDDFKVINDQMGHLAGDSVLADVAERLRSVVRGPDISCRVGGDEFAVILPEATEEDAQRLFRRLQVAVEGQAVGRADRMRFSAGIAEFREGDDAPALFQRADEALFRAKRQGKGTLFVSDEPPER